MVQAASQLMCYTELSCPLGAYVAVWFIPHVRINFMQEVRERSPVFPWWYDVSLPVTAGHILLHHYG